MGKQQIRVHTFLQDLELTIDKKTIGRQLVLEICNTVSVKETLYYSLLYDTKDGKRKFMSLDKPVLGHKIDSRHRPLQFYLRLRIHPPKPNEIQHERTKLMIYRELKQAIETGEISSPAELTTELNPLAAEDRIDEYLEKLATRLPGYGITPYNMRRDDGYPILLCASLSGITIVAGTEKTEIPFSKMKNVKRGSKSLTILQLAPAPDVKVTGPDSNFAKEVQETIMANYAIHKQLQGK